MMTTTFAVNSYFVLKEEHVPTNSTNLAMIDFHGSSVLAMEAKDGIFIPVIPICETLGIGECFLEI